MTWPNPGEDAVEELDEHLGVVAVPAPGSKGGGSRLGRGGPTALEGDPPGVG
jgi:hypothetical protein